MLVYAAGGPWMEAKNRGRAGIAEGAVYVLIIPQNMPTPIHGENEMNYFNQICTQANLHWLPIEA